MNRQKIERLLKENYKVRSPKLVLFSQFIFIPMFFSLFFLVSTNEYLFFVYMGIFASFTLFNVATVNKKRNELMSKLETHPQEVIDYLTEYKKQKPAFLINEEMFNQIIREINLEAKEEIAPKANIEEDLISYVESAFGIKKFKWIILMTVLPQLLIVLLITLTSDSSIFMFFLPVMALMFIVSAISFYRRRNFGMFIIDNYKYNLHECVDKILKVVTKRNMRTKTLQMRRRNINNDNNSQLVYFKLLDLLIEYDPTVESYINNYLQEY